MSGQQSKGGQQYGQPYAGNPYYMNQQSLYNPNGLNGSYFSQGGSARGGYATSDHFAPYGSYAQLGGGSGMNPVGGNPFQAGGVMTALSGGGNPFQSGSANGGGSPFQGAQGAGAFNMPGQGNPFQAPQAKPYVRPIDASVNPFQAPAQFGPTPPQSFDYTQTPTVPNTNDPNSPAYAAYYNSLPASTRSYLAPPGSALASYIATNYNNSPFKF